MLLANKTRYLIRTTRISGTLLHRQSTLTRLHAHNAHNAGARKEQDLRLR